MTKDDRGGTQAIYPFLRYGDAPAAIDWLVAVFGFECRAVYEDDSGGIAHAQLTLGSGLVTLSSLRPGVKPSGGKDLAIDGGIFAYVDDVDAHFERARAGGAEIIADPVDQPYGHRDYTCRDLEGNLWSFGDFHP
jgi:uncharacterized glyoxalase superfamily protein PhnB